MRRISTNARIAAGLLVCLTTTLLARPVHADPAVEVSTACNAEDMGIYGDGINNILDQLRFQIVQYLQSRDRLAYWSFAQGSTASGNPGHSQAPRLAFEILEPQKRNLQVRMTYTSVRGPQHWEATWREPGQLFLSGYPDQKDAADDLFKTIRPKLLEANEELLRSLLINTAPLATGGRWDPSATDPRLVLPLPWDRYSMLRRSQFRLECAWSTGNGDAEGELISRATSLPAQFQDGNQQSYRALTVSPLTWRPFEQERPQPVKKIPSKIRKLTPKWAYLYKEDISGLNYEIFEGRKQ